MLKIDVLHSQIRSVCYGFKINECCSVHTQLLSRSLIFLLCNYWNRHSQRDSPPLKPPLCACIFKEFKLTLTNTAQKLNLNLPVVRMVRNWTELDNNLRLFSLKTSSILWSLKAKQYSQLIVFVVSEILFGFLINEGYQRHRMPFLRVLLQSCCGILAKRGAFWQQFRKETRTRLQQNLSIICRSMLRRRNAPFL